MSGTHAATTGPEGDKNVAQRELYDVRFRLGAYRHYKGSFYIAYSVTVDEATLEPMVHYYSLDKKTRWTRTVKNFTELVDKDGHKIQRFVWSYHASWQELAVAAGLEELLAGLRHLAAGQAFLANIRPILGG